MFGGTQKYFGRTQVEKHWSKPSVLLMRVFLFYYRKLEKNLNLLIIFSDLKTISISGYHVNNDL
jgi:hypothetical protein